MSRLNVTRHRQKRTSRILHTGEFYFRLQESKEFSSTSLIMKVASHCLVVLVALLGNLSTSASGMVVHLKALDKNVIISPSVAKANLLNLEADLRSAVDGGAEWLHFSVQDGRMIPKISFGTAVVEACRKAFPTTVLDVKLGCVEPEHCISDFVKVGADIISVHPESTLQLGAVINKIHASGVAPGVVLNPGTSISAVEHVLDQCQVAVVMLVCVEELVPGSLEFVDFI